MGFWLNMIYEYSSYYVSVTLIIWTVIVIIKINFFNNQLTALYSLRRKMDYFILFRLNASGLLDQI